MTARTFTAANDLALELMPFVCVIALGLVLILLIIVVVHVCVWWQTGSWSL